MATSESGRIALGESPEDRTLFDRLCATLGHVTPTVSAGLQNFQVGKRIVSCVPVTVMYFFSWPNETQFRQFSPYPLS